MASPFLLDSSNDVQGEKCIPYRRDLGLISLNMLCGKCNREMSLRQKTIFVTSDKQVWACRKCRTSTSMDPTWINIEGRKIKMLCNSQIGCCYDVFY